jgi:hypothetical protein
MVNKSGVQASIGNGQTMNQDAARYYNSLVALIYKETGLVIVATEGTRTYARQAELYNGYVRGRIDPSTGKKYNPAYSPDSPHAYHLSGQAVDVGSSVGYSGAAAYRAWRERMLSYGFRETVPGEPWHFEWRYEWVSVAIEPSSSDATPLPIDNQKDVDMPTYELVKQNGADTVYYSVDRIQRKAVTGAELPDYQDFIKRQGQNHTVQNVNSITSFGVDISKKPEKILIKKRGGDGTVWLSIDRTLRVPITSSTLAAYQWWLGKEGYDNRVFEDDNVAAFGAII